MAQITFQHFLQQTVLRHHLKAQLGIYITPDIPYKKRLGAQYYLPEQINHSAILLLVDDTVFGSAKAGLVVTDMGLYYRADFESMSHYPFQMLQSIEAKLGLINHDLILNHQIQLDFTQLSSPSIQILAQVLNAFLQQLHDHDEHKQYVDRDAMSVVHACKLFELQPEQLNSLTLKQAYRKKIAIFHPDQYHNLPLAVQELIADHAQQLNQAREVLQEWIRYSE